MWVCLAVGAGDVGIAYAYSTRDALYSRVPRCVAGGGGNLPGQATSFLTRSRSEDGTGRGLGCPCVFLVSWEDNRAFDMQFVAQPAGTSDTDA